MKVSLKDDAMPDGTELHVRHLGTLVNGETVEFSEGQVATFENVTGKKLDKAFANDPRISVMAKASSKKGGDDN